MNVHIAVHHTIFVEGMTALCNKMIAVQFMTNLARKGFKQNALPEEILDCLLQLLIPIVFEDKDPDSQNKYGIAEEETKTQEGQLKQKRSKSREDTKQDG